VDPRVAVVILTIALLAPPPVAAQAEPPPSGSRNWFSRLLPRPPARTIQTALLPGARSVMLSDQRRETRLEKMESEARIARDKGTRLAELRQDRDRRVAAAIARAAPAAPFRPAATPHSIVGATPAPLQPAIVASELPAATSPQASSTPPPPITSAPPEPPTRATPIPAPPSTPSPAQITGNSVETAPAAEAGQDAPTGLFALALIGLFLVPAMGVGLIFVGFAHLRGHSFISGTAIIIAGALVLWGAYTAARLINPDLLTFGEKQKSGAPVGAETLLNLRSDAFWGNE